MAGRLLATVLLSDVDEPGVCGIKCTLRLPVSHSVLPGVLHYVSIGTSFDLN